MHKPDNVPLQLPRAQFTYRQRQVIIDWYWGLDPDYSKKPLNSMAATCAQLRVRINPTKLVGADQIL